jgi:RNA polymerase sigma-70 factor, ECF subfamily
MAEIPYPLASGKLSRIKSIRRKETINRVTGLSEEKADREHPVEKELLADKEHPFEQVFHQYWERTCSIAYRLVGNQAEAEDIALEAFLRLHQKPPGREDNLGGWLYRVTTRLGLNALRSRSRRETYETQHYRHDTLSARSDDPESLLETRQEREQVRFVLSKMKDRSAQILVLRASGLNYGEIAGVLKIRPGSVGTLLARAEKEFLERYNRLFL